jgi:hypothetical protein
VADREQLDGATLGGAADGLETGEARELRDQRAGAGAELLERQEFPMIGNAGEIRSEVYRRASDE